VRAVWCRPAPDVADLVVLLARAQTGNATGSDFVIDDGLITTL
jgi:hypothetical protein